MESLCLFLKKFYLYSKFYGTLRQCRISRIISQKLCPGKYLQYNFIRCSLIHPHNTRASTSENYYIKYSRTNQLSNSIAIFGAKLWNCFPLGISRLPFLALQLYMNTEWQFLYISLRNCHQKQFLRCLAFQSFSFIDNTSLLSRRNLPKAGFWHL